MVKVLELVATMLKEIESIKENAYGGYFLAKQHAK